MNQNYNVVKDALKVAKSVDDLLIGEEVVYANALFDAIEAWLAGPCYDNCMTIRRWVWAHTSPQNSVAFLVVLKAAQTAVAVQYAASEEHRAGKAERDMAVKLAAQARATTDHRTGL